MLSARIEMSQSVERIGAGLAKRRFPGCRRDTENFFRLLYATSRTLDVVILLRRACARPITSLKIHLY